MSLNLELSLYVEWLPSMPHELLYNYPVCQHVFLTTAGLLCHIMMLVFACT